MAARGKRKTLVVVDDTWIASLLLDDSSKAFETRAGIDRRAHPPRSIGAVARNPSEDEHTGRQLDGDVDQVRWSASLQHLETLDDLDRVADCTAKRRVHPRDDGFRLHPGGRSR